MPFENDDFRKQSNCQRENHHSTAIRSHQITITTNHYKHPIQIPWNHQFHGQTSIFADS
jgi:hypothetical protein